jgi:hypothetical protein
MGKGAVKEKVDDGMALVALEEEGWVVSDVIVVHLSEGEGRVV